MGFPIWTLWGMGLAALGALLFLFLALIAQSPLLLQRIGLSRLRLDLRVRTFTSLAFALLLLAMAFFLAGVPLNAGEEVASFPNEEASATLEAELISSPSALDQLPTATSTIEGSVITTPITPETGAFGGPPATEVIEPTISTTLEPTELEQTPTSRPTITPTSSQTVVPTAASTATPTKSPTLTPTPSLTPTPIDGVTVVIDTGGSTIWLKRSPGGQNISILQHEDIVILLARHANQAGQIWQEVRTVDGITGWILEEFLQAAE